MIWCKYCKLPFGIHHQGHINRLEHYAHMQFARGEWAGLNELKLKRLLSKWNSGGEQA